MNHNTWRCAGCTTCEKCNHRQGSTALLNCAKCGSLCHAGCAGPHTPKDLPTTARWLCETCVECENCKAKSPGENKYVFNALVFLSQLFFFFCGRVADYYFPLPLPLQSLAL